MSNGAISSRALLQRLVARGPSLSANSRRRGGKSLQLSKIKEREKSKKQKEDHLWRSLLALHYSVPKRCKQKNSKSRAEAGREYNIALVLGSLWESKINRQKQKRQARRRAGKYSPIGAHNAQPRKSISESAKQHLEQNQIIRMFCVCIKLILKCYTHTIIQEKSSFLSLFCSCLPVMHILYYRAGRRKCCVLPTCDYNILINRPVEGLKFNIQPLSALHPFMYYNPPLKLIVMILIISTRPVDQNLD